ncbi:hypothetical protein AB3N62_18470 [Leptospira sp. WS4.C2]
MNDFFILLIIMLMLLPWLISFVLIVKINIQFYVKNNGIDLDTSREDFKKLKNTDSEFKKLNSNLFKWGIITIVTWASIISTFFVFSFFL